MDRWTFLAGSAAALLSTRVDAFADEAGAGFAWNSFAAGGPSRSEGATSHCSQNIRFYETFIANDQPRVSALREHVLDGSFQVVSPGLAEFHRNRVGDTVAAANAWMLWAEQGGTRFLLDFNDSNEAIPGAGKTGFISWVRDFQPRNYNDWSMVPSFYHRHIYDRDSVDWCSAPAFIASPRIDPILATTRGLMPWSAQAERIVGECCDVSRREARGLWKRYLRQEADTIRRFEKIRIDGRSLPQILDERTLERNFCFGRPDYPLAKFLSRHADVLLGDVG